MAFIVFDKTFAANGKIRYLQFGDAHETIQEAREAALFQGCALPSSSTLRVLRRLKAKRRYDCEMLKATAPFGRKADRADGRAERRER